MTKISVKNLKNQKWLSKIAKTEEEKIILAVTGKMAAGKNYVCSELEKLGWKSIDADVLVHKAIEISKDKILDAFSKIAESEGLNLLNPDGSVNRRAIGQIVFKNPELLKKQEEIVYPVINSMIDDFIDENDRAIINATVLYKTPQILERCDAVIFVTAPFFVRFFRAKKRDGLSCKQIFLRFKNQKNLLKKYKTFGKNIIIVNNF